MGAPPTPALRELVLVTQDSVRAFPLVAGSTVRIGRAPDNDVVIDDATVSRHHASLQVAEDVTARDLGSDNGTRLRANATSDGEQTVPLRRIARDPVVVGLGDELTLGGVTVFLRAIAARPPSGPVLSDPSTRAVFDEAAKVAPSMLSVLVFGETGTGKELVARVIHEASDRAQGPFVAVNCGALSPSLIESELFGHERGAFTGAHGAKEGFIEAAHRGTLFLDEVGELPLALQASLLRVLEDRKVTRVGARSPREVDVRFVSATNRDLRGAMAAGTFRSDLYFRLGGSTIEIPPLRKRPADVEPLARRFLDEATKTLSRREPPRFSQDALDVLRGYEYPGNVRELRNIIERAVLLAGGPSLLPKHLPLHVVSAVATPPGAAQGGSPAKERHAAAEPPAPAKAATGGNLERDLRTIERQRILEALEAHAGNQTRAARSLGLSRRTFVNRLNEYGLARPRKG